MKTNSENNNCNKKQEIILSFHEINVATSEKKIINNMSGYIEEGSLVAIMGMSGSGKSTLLNALSGRHNLTCSSYLTGNVYFKNRQLCGHLRNKIGYVMQDDLLFERMTVRETAMFHARVRLSSELTDLQRFEKVLFWSKQLGLDNILENVIGGPSSGISGISGGEKKRLSILLELLTDPDILMLDEPTSGLDATTARNVVELLSNLCKNSGKTIVASIHQPNSKIFHLFDKLILIANGEMCYFGNVSEVPNFFNLINAPCPSNWNIADHIIEVCSNENYFSPIRKSFKEYILPQICQVTANPVIIEEKTNDITDVTMETKRWPSNFKTQLYALMDRAYILSYRKTINTLFFLKALFIALIVGMLWFQLPSRNALIADYTGLFFWAVTNSVGTEFFESYFFFMDEFKYIQREHLGSIYRISPFYISKLILECLFIVFNRILVWGIAYWATGISYSYHFLLFFLVIVLSAFVGQVCGNVFNCLPFRPKQIISIMGIYFTLILATGGFLIRSIPSWLTWIKYLSPIYHAYRILAEIQLLAGIPCGSGDIGEFPSCSQAGDMVSREEFLKKFYIDFNVWYSAVFMITVLITGHIFTYLAIRIKLKSPKKKPQPKRKIVNSIKSKYAKLTRSLSSDP